ncbi:uncharacterized membrane protein YcgQ (UPF0703/DUF1980 family) [Anoxybacillus tepidamans]|uniref:Uncharacterized membrane protein YcgQ (UPF0703/DUF1980 family) n=1 Tax=Anoxybacteroides tepidamans TaxID=265948 RepID=A0A7W8IRT5_9BACL|nr:DUF1980 domain-containing protein [Anoxybacillus tepidamans]MBB5325459.1 uncharacterized membrane protein YcgQ (UPF0703/DUF1980 family) [Anoxybacillus tepidamans]
MNNPFVQRQFLRPDTSIYCSKDGYDDLMQKELVRFSKQSRLVLNDRNDLKGLKRFINF